MLVGNNSNVQANSFNLLSNFNQTQSSTTTVTPVRSVYTADTVDIVKPTYPPENPPQPPADSTPGFFHNPLVRIGGMMLGGGALVGGVGYLIGSAFGSAAMGATIGATLGVLAPVGMLAYALYSWGHPKTAS